MNKSISNFFNDKYKLHWAIDHNYNIWLILDELMPYLGYNNESDDDKVERAYIYDLLKSRHPQLIISLPFDIQNDDLSYALDHRFDENRNNIVEQTLIQDYAAYCWAMSIETEDPSINEFKEWLLNSFIATIHELASVLSYLSMNTLSKNIGGIDIVAERVNEFKEAYEKYLKSKTDTNV